MAQIEFEIEISLENKPAARDPVAETIQRDLLAKKGYDQVSKVRSGQYLRINLLADSEEKAKELITKMCNDLRIFNPVTQILNIINVNKV
ncbi:MAG: phosphoribosylformylglycinamidine synthase, purS protein [Candidatus Lokiarchaeota archaeon]|nr:phosphoribosylformylglycinamidine synthase, purS protein [Candidatus Lokiarchaeota archaeon]